MLKIKFLRKRLPVLSFLMIFIFTSCNDDDDNTVTVHEESLKRYELVRSLTSQEVEQLVVTTEQVFGGMSYGLTSYKPVKVYKVVYEQSSEYNGGVVEVSGLVTVPDDNEVLPVISYQHGTIFDPQQAPSLFNLDYKATVFGVILASQGFAVSLPDYEGYGVSENLKHPYEHAKSLALSSYEMLVAAKQLLEKENRQINNKLFLGGYSEGGGATMALHQYIENNTHHVVTMSAPASGAYNKTAFTLEVDSKNENLTFLPNYMWVINSYNNLYKINRPWNAIVNDTDAQLLENEANPMNYYMLPIQTNPQNLFKSTFLLGLKNGTDQAFLNALKDNDTYNWTPKAPITLYYGTADDYVYPLNSITAKEAILNNGGTVTEVVYQGATHTTAFPLYTRDVLKLFASLK
ncbi:MAG: alpha/beta hydrolase family protein [Flavobacteriales bacterium]